MNFIKLTYLNNKETIYINPLHIGHIYRTKEKITFGRIEQEEHTIVGTTTHNNGGFKVYETPQEILKLISNLSK
jgi:hypothetical protein